MLVSRSIALADFVIIPVQVSAEDVRQASKAIRAVRDEERVAQRSNASRSILFKVLMTRTPAPGAPISSVQQHLRLRLTPLESSVQDKPAEHLAYKANIC